MKIEGPAVRLTIFVGEDDNWHHKPLYHEIVHRAHVAGLAGASVLRGIEGFGRAARIHTTRILRLSEYLPIVIEVVDQEDRLRAILPELETMLADGLITAEPVEVIAYRSRSVDEAAERG